MKANRTRRVRRGRGKTKGDAGSQTEASVPLPAHSVLGRVLRYGDKIYGICRGLRSIKDERVKPRIPAGRVALAFVLLMLAGLGSLNALEQREANGAWCKWLGGPLPSADVMGDVASSLDLGRLREVLRRQHKRLKRNKGFGRDRNGLRYLVLDGHEGVSSYRRRWRECLERIVHFASGDRVQFYHRYVAAYLTNGRQFFMLDAEGQLPGEGEIACAMRLLRRIFEHHSRAFDVVCGDNLYMDPKLYRLVRSHHKELIAVLKNENRDLLEDARSLFQNIAPTSFDDEKTARACWDLEGFTTWPQCGEPVRVVRTIEQTPVKRQQSGELETCISEWFWVTSLSPLQACTQTIVCAGHGRWGIENNGFNELTNQWHGDHGYRYHAHALLACTLLLFIAYNLFHAFLERNLKPQARAGRTRKYWADLIAAEFAIAFHPYAMPP